MDSLPLNRPKVQHVPATSSPVSSICSLPTGKMQIINSTPFTPSTAVILPLHMIFLLVQNFFSILFFQMFLNFYLARHGLSEADFSSATQCVHFTIPRCCNFWKIKNVLCPKLGMSHSRFTCLGSPLNEE